MNSHLLIQILLIVAIAAIGWIMLRSRGGSLHQAGRRLLTLLFVVFAVVAIASPDLVTWVAHFVGVGRGTDLLLYALVIAFLAQVLSSFRRDVARERQITKLARRIALDEARAHAAAPEPHADADPR